MAKFETFLAKIDDLERSKFYEPRKKDFEPIIDELQNLYEEDKIERLCIAVPPGVGKSYLALLYALFCAVSKPDFRVLILTTSKHCVDNNLESLLWLLDKGKSGIFKKYRWWHSKEEGKIEICKARARSTIIYISTLNAFEKHYYKAKPLDLIVSDDISGSTKHGIYAEEEELREINEKYEFSRLRRKLDGKEMHICSRIDLNDLFGYMYKRYSDDSGTKFINVPLINDDETINFEYAYSPEMQEKMQRELRGDKYEAIILGKPSDDWKTFNEYIKLHPDCIKKRKG